MPYNLTTCQGINGRFVCPKRAAVQLTPGFLGRVLANLLNSGFFGALMINKQTRFWWSIYKLVDPTNQAVMYIGATSHTLKTRLNSHVAEARRINWTDKSIWINGLIKRGLLPRIVLIDQIYGFNDDAERLENLYIKSVIDSGAKLLNKRVTWKVPFYCFYKKYEDRKLKSVFGRRHIPFTGEL